jgi:GLPGLI family protein
MYSELYGSNSNGDNSWYEEYKSKIPQSKSKFFDLYFNGTVSVFKPGRKAEEGENKWIGSTPVDDDVVLSDFKTGMVTAHKELYGDKIIIADTLKRIKWKILGEVRTIENFKCRKAVGKICDSVYVVAFYTDDILVSGGPEMFGGLPGMILELSIPRLYTTWIATKIDVTPPKESDFAISSHKGKKFTHAQMEEELRTTAKNWGDWGQRFIWWGVL